MTKNDTALDKQIETLRALLGESASSTRGLSKQQGLSIIDTTNNTNDMIDSAAMMAEPGLDTSTITDSPPPTIKPLPTATKTFKPRDFLHFKKHSNEQSLVLIKRFLSKHGMPEANSSELQALTNAISRIIGKPESIEPHKR